jgi:hypothetical protein
LGSDQRNNRVAVIASHVRACESEAQVECRWQSEHRGGIAKETGIDKGGKDGTSGREEIGSKENGGEGRSGDEGGEEATEEDGQCFQSDQNGHGPIEQHRE